MKSWPDQKLLKLLRIENPVIQAPMAGVDTPELAVAVTKAGGLGSLACALLSPAQIHDAWASMRKKTTGSINLNFFCHELREDNVIQQKNWKNRLLPYYKEFGINPDTIADTPVRMPFDENFCDVIEETKPPIVSFHFGLPTTALLQRVKKSGAVILSSATTLEEAIWLEAHGCDVIIAQGLEAGGHRGIFLTDDLTTQTHLIPLIKQIKRSVSVPVIAAGGIADAESIKVALDCGASAVQLGTAYLFCPETRVSKHYRQALETGAPTALTNVFSGRPARGIINRLIKEAGPLAPEAPDFPYAARLVTPLRHASEHAGSHEFMQLWAGTIRQPHHMHAEELTKVLCEQTLGIIST